MEKKKHSTNQPTLFPKRPIPKMPDGYYSSGPNPNLRRFVEKHATPYDPATDKYKVKPFNKPITTTKATAIYNMHTYWSKKPHDAIREYIKHYTKPGDIVLDPFCGSGGTALAALMEGRAAIAIDLSPAATFITKNYCTPVDVDELQRVFEELERKIKPDMNWLYETRCDRCDGKATTAYTVHSSVYQCPRCLEKLPLFDCVDVQGETKGGKPKTLRVCPHCYGRGITEEIKTTQEKFGVQPVLVCYLCQEGCKPQRDQRTHNDPNPKKHAYFQEYDLGKIDEVEACEIPYWYPEANLAEEIPYRMLYKQDFRPEDASKLTHLYTKRNLWALASIISHVKEFDILYQHSLLFTVSSFLLNVSRLYRYRLTGGGQPTGNYYIPQINRENEAWSAFERKFKQIKEAVEILPSVLIGEPEVMVSTQSAVRLKEVENNSIDYIFTDPPYSGNVQYGELNFLWEAWLGFDTEWKQEEIIVNDIAGKSEEDWESSLQAALAECFRVLKPGRWLSLCYHDTSEGTWMLIQDMMSEIGFLSDRLSSTIFIDTGQKTINQSQAKKVAKRDLVINFRKPRPTEISGQLTLFDASDFATFQEAARAVLVEALTSHPGSTADRLYDELISRMVRKGQLERHNFDAVLRSVAEPVSEARMANLFEKEPPNLFGSHETVRWYLKASADMLDEAESAKESAAASRLESFVKGYLAENPEEMGVHYSDLFEQYLPVEDKPRRLLQDWLPEFFFKTPEGTWRSPVNDQERAHLAALHSSGLLRRVKRFGNALLQGVPPAERDKPESAATLADWVRQCRRAGLYEIGRALYEKSGMNFESLDEVAQIELEEDYQICVRRS